MKVLFVIVSLIFCLARVECVEHPFFKVFSQPTPIYRGRADPIISPGQTSQHSHKVFGGSGFGLGTGRTSEQLYNDLLASSCTTMTVTADKSNYWIPDLYYRWPNGSLSLVPNGGLTVYYMGRDGSRDLNPTYEPFPPGFRMVTGYPFRRTFSNTIPERAVQWLCLTSPSIAETQPFPTTTRPCINGLRAQVFFPQCWDGRLDSPNHADHVAYPIEDYNGGNCPSTHPRRLLSVFYEILFDVIKFPHGTGGSNQFVLAPGDITGYGLHGDFLNGWPVSLQQSILSDPTCLSGSTNNGNSPQNCNALRPYIKSSNTDGSCVLDKPIYNYEDLGINHWIDHLPGNNPITGLNFVVTPRTGSYAQVISPNVFRVVFKSVRNGLYVSSRRPNDALVADTTSSQLTYTQVFDFTAVGGGKYSMGTESFGRFVSSNNGGSPITGDRYNPSDWEFFSFSFVGGTTPTAAGTTGSLLASNNKYISVQANGQLIASSSTIGPNEQFVFYDANAGVPDTRT